LIQISIQNNHDSRYLLSPLHLYYWIPNLGFC
jgi:hypothetical protein